MWTSKIYWRINSNTVDWYVTVVTKSGPDKVGIPQILQQTATTLASADLCRNIFKDKIRAQVHRAAKQLLTVKHRERHADLPAVIASKWVTQQYKSVVNAHPPLSIFLLTGEIRSCPGPWLAKWYIPNDCLITCFSIETREFHLNYQNWLIGYKSCYVQESFFAKSFSFSIKCLIIIFFPAVKYALHLDCFISCSTTYQDAMVLGWIEKARQKMKT